MILLQALFDRASPQGLGLLHFNPYHTLSIEEAKIIIIHNRGDVDYVKGRAMKVDVSGDTLNTRLFNRDITDQTLQKKSLDRFE